MRKLHCTTFHFLLLNTKQPSVFPHQAAIHSTSRSFNEEKLSKEVAFLEEKLLATEEVAAAEISSLQEVQVSLQGQLQRCKSHIAELTNKLQETEMVGD